MNVEICQDDQVKYTNLIYSAHQQLFTELEFCLTENSLTVNKEFVKYFENRVEVFYNKCVSILEDKPESQTKLFKTPNNTNLLMIIYSNLFDFHRSLFNQQVGGELNEMINDVTIQFEQKEFNKQLKIMCFIGACKLVNIQGESESSQSINNDENKKFFDALNFEFSLTNVDLNDEVRQEDTNNVNSYWPILLYLLNVL